MTNLIDYNLVFKAAWHHFILMNNNPSSTAKGCAYRGRDGNKCAVGLLLPDSVAAACEGQSASGVVQKYPSLFCDEIVKDATPTRAAHAFDSPQNRPHDQHVTSDMYRSDDILVWSRCRGNRRHAYLETAALFFKLDTSWMNIPVTHTMEECKELVWQLEFGELDGWHYLIEWQHHDQYAIAVLDENSKFVSFWCM